MAPISISLIEVAANTEATETRVPFDKGECHHDMVDSYGISVSE
jgi:hypothetical protein